MDSKIKFCKFTVLSSIFSFIFTRVCGILSLSITWGYKIPSVFTNDGFILKTLSILGSMWISLLIIDCFRLILGIFSLFSFPVTLCNGILRKFKITFSLWKMILASYWLKNWELSKPSLCCQYRQKLIKMDLTITIFSLLILEIITFSGIVFNGLLNICGLQIEIPAPVN